MLWIKNISVVRSGIYWKWFNIGGNMVIKWNFWELLSSLIIDISDIF